MPQVVYGTHRCRAEHGSNLLDTMISHGFPVSHGCRSGVCRSCLMVALEGDIPAAAQAGLSAAERKQNLLLACQCTPVGDLVVGDAGARLDVPALILQREQLSSRVVRLSLALEGALEYVAGQFVNLVRDDGLARSYSVASLPGESTLELHVGHVDRGRMSGWLFAEADPGTRVAVRGPYGTCCYDAETTMSEDPLLLVGIGTGLAPLWGIARDALARGHTGPITLHHGARTGDGLYLHQPLTDLARSAANFAYHAHVLEGDAPSGATVGPLALAMIRDRLPPEHPLGAHRAFLCGAPDFVQNLRRGLFLAGCGLKKIHADAFVMAPPPVSLS